MQVKKILGWAAAVILTVAGTGYGLHVANANDNGRAIPTLEATSPSAGSIVVTWDNPSETDTLASYRVSWGLWENGLTSYREANTDTGGNAYPTAPASSHTITGLAPGEYIVAVRARYDDNRNGAFKESGKVTVAAPTPEPTATPTPEPTSEPPQRGEPKGGPSKTRTEPAADEVEEQEPESAEQQADPCASLEIAEVGGWASNGYALWVWKGSPVADGGCWVDFKLSYSDDYGATFTEAAVVRRYMHTTATEYRHSISTVPEMSIVSQLQVQVCAPDSDTCPHTLKSTDASFDQYYYSRHENKTAGANTKALLVPANSSDSGNASVTGWLEYDDTETHTYRIAMTAGKTYVFDETYRKWALMSGEWRGGEHYYLPDEFRISLYTKNSAGQLVAVSDFQNQPEFGWQAIHEDTFYPEGSTDDEDVAHDYQQIGNSFGDNSSAEEYFEVVEQLLPLFDNAHLFPPGSRWRHACNLDKSNLCGPGFDIRTDKGRQLRTASYVPTRSGIYYLQVTRIRDDQPVYRDGEGGWSLVMSAAGSFGRVYMPVYAKYAAKSQELRSALPYYEISVEARGPTLTSIRFAGDSYLEIYGQGGKNQFGFLPGRFLYRIGLLEDVSTLTVTTTTAHSDATVSFSPADADTSTAGHQINPAHYALTNFTITVTKGSDQETYTFELSRP